MKTLLLWKDSSTLLSFTKDSIITHNLTDGSRTYSAFQESSKVNIVALFNEHVVFGFAGKLVMNTSPPIETNFWPNPDVTATCFTCDRAKQLLIVGTSSGAVLQFDHSLGQKASHEITPATEDENPISDIQTREDTYTFIFQGSLHELHNNSRVSKKTISCKLHRWTEVNLVTATPDAIKIYNFSLEQLSCTSTNTPALNLWCLGNKILWAEAGSIEFWNKNLAWPGYSKPYPSTEETEETIETAVLSPDKQQVALATSRGNVTVFSLI